MPFGFSRHLLNRNLRSLAFAILSFVSVVLVVGGEELAAAEPDGGGEGKLASVDFDREIRPILSQNCFACHGPDEQSRQAELRLDLKSGAFGEGESGERAILPGDASASELFRRLVSSDEDEVMPPRDSNNHLSEEQIELIRRWIDEGAAWEPHWAFTAPQSPAVPHVKNSAWPRDPLDRFVLARLEEEGLAPSQEADRRTLIRRVTMDLTGLPPTPQEVADFLADEGADAYEKVVDRLLATTRYAERMTLEWLDAARYADTHGYHEDYHRDMWPWRDWVIHAFNENMPFDQFATDQIAGDLIPNRTNRQLTATGFCRNHGITASGISEEYRVEYALDRARTTSTVFLGLTVGCAQCHDHKYDPISQKDFYRYFAYFNTVSDRGVENGEGNMRPRAAVVPSMLESKFNRDKELIASLEKQLNSRRGDVAGRLAKWESQIAELEDWTPDVSTALDLRVAFDETEGQELTAKRPQNAISDEVPGRSSPDDSVTSATVTGTIEGAVGWVAGKHAGALKLDGSTRVNLGDVASLKSAESFSFGAWVHAEGDGAILGRTNQDSSYRGYDLRIQDGRLILRLASAWTIRAIGVRSLGKVPLGEWSHIFVTYDGSGRAAGVALYIDGEPQKLDIPYDRLKGPIDVEGELQIGHRHNYFGLKGMIDDVRIYRRALSGTEVAQLAGRDPIRPLLAISADQRTAEQREKLQQYFLTHEDADYRATSEEQRRLRQGIRLASAKLPTVMVMEEMSEPRDTFVLIRGQYDQRGEKVRAGVPDVLPPLPEGAPANRLGLAQWLTDPAHPLTSRVTINRFWQMAFGTGIVKTSEDFGIQGERPSHPRLLDYLATEFVRNDWNVKAIMKRLVMSATYRQSSVASRDLLAQDPENRLLARGPRYRLPAEIIRDNALFASGLLVEKLGGPSVKPYQPAGLWVEISNRGYTQDKGDNLYRRSMYTYWKRAVPPPNLAALDAPNRETCTVRRQRTNTPLMALVLLNDPTFVEASRALAERVMVEGASTREDRLARIFELLLSRPPNSAETKVLTGLYDRQLAVYSADAEAAAALLAVGESPRNESLDLAEHAAWTCVASMVLNLDEAMSKE